VGSRRKRSTDLRRERIGGVLPNLLEDEVRLPLKAGDRAMLQAEHQHRRAETREDDENDGLGLPGSGPGESRFGPRTSPYHADINGENPGCQGQKISNSTTAYANFLDRLNPTPRISEHFWGSTQSAV
jgi:hypothetical protein